MHVPGIKWIRLYKISRQSQFYNTVILSSSCLWFRCENWVPARTLHGCSTYLLGGKCNLSDQESSQDFSTCSPQCLIHISIITAWLAHCSQWCWLLCSVNGQHVTHGPGFSSSYNPSSIPVAYHYLSLTKSNGNAP